MKIKANSQFLANRKIEKKANFLKSEENQETTKNEGHYHVVGKDFLNNPTYSVLNKEKGKYGNFNSVDNNACNIYLEWDLYKRFIQLVNENKNEKERLFSAFNAFERNFKKKSKKIKSDIKPRNL